MYVYEWMVCVFQGHVRSSTIYKWLFASTCIEMLMELQRSMEAPSACIHTVKWEQAVLISLIDEEHPVIT